MPTGSLGATARITAGVAVGMAVLVTTAVGCTQHAGRGDALYAEGRYIEAAEVYERTEYRLSESSADEQAQYGLYRGLTLLELGDSAHARQWLAFAQQVETRAPGSLGEDERARLQGAWAKLEAMQSAEPRPTDDQAIAATVPESLPPAVRGGNGRRNVPAAGSVAR